MDTDVQTLGSCYPSACPGEHCSYKCGGGCPSCSPSHGSDQVQLYQGFPFLPTPLCCSPIVQDDRTLDLLVNEVTAYTAANGLMMMKRPDGVLTHIPVTLLPTPFPRDAYHYLQRLATTFNTLYDRICHDHTFLFKCLEETSKVDSFIGRLLNIMTTVDEEKKQQQQQQPSWSFCINRSDYMMHSNPDGSFLPQQVEFNTISAGMACLSSKVTQMHRYMVSRHVPHYARTQDMPTNNSMDGIVTAMALAYSRYADTFPSAHDLSILMIVQKDEWNIVDQQLLAFALWNHHSIPMIRKTLAEVDDQVQIDEQGHLIIDGRIIAVTYFRAGYTPKDFPSEKAWHALLQIERSLTIKCPSVSYHLAGCKKIQQVLAASSSPSSSSNTVLEQFLSKEEAQFVQSCFTGLWSLTPGDEQTRHIINEAISHPGEYVLKPQREGGCNNIWDNDMVATLTQSTADQLAGYILMRQIEAPVASVAGLRLGQLQKFRGINELGIFGVYLSDGMTIHINEAVGYLLRTKRAENNEGGISAGSGFLDSVVLV